jgi:hypothetical protein
MIERGAGCWEIRLSGSVRGRVATRAMGEILWHRRETRRQTENTNFALQPRGAPDLLESLLLCCSSVLREDLTLLLCLREDLGNLAMLPVVREPRKREALPSNV